MRCLETRVHDLEAANQKLQQELDARVQLESDTKKMETELKRKMFDEIEQVFFKNGEGGSGKSDRRGNKHKRKPPQK